MIGNYENWVFAQPVKDWWLVSYESLNDSLYSLMRLGLVNASWGDLPRLWGDVYQWCCVGLEKSDPQTPRNPTPPRRIASCIFSRLGIFPFLR